MSLFITGGTGSLGSAICGLPATQNLSRVVVYSRSESRQADMKSRIPEGGAGGMRYILGDIRDQYKMSKAMTNCEYVIHAAAMKRIDTCEYDPMEAVSVNIDGTMNVIKSCLENNVASAIFVSTDKACEPVSLYGATKMAAERAWIAANNLGKTRFNVCRYGNVLSSTGSLLKIWEQQLKAEKPVSITAKGMRRYFWSLAEASEFVMLRMFNNDSQKDRGVIYVPQMRSFDIEEMSTPYAKFGTDYTGARCPEKLNEDLVSVYEGEHCYKREGYYAIYPSYHDWSGKQEIIGEAVPEGFKMSTEVAEL